MLLRRLRARPPSSLCRARRSSSSTRLEARRCCSGSWPKCPASRSRWQQRHPRFARETRSTPPPLRPCPVPSGCAWASGPAGETEPVFHDARIRLQRAKAGHPRRVLPRGRSAHMDASGSGGRGQWRNGTFGYPFRVTGSRSVVAPARPCDPSARSATGPGSRSGRSTALPCDPFVRSASGLGRPPGRPGALPSGRCARSAAHPRVRCQRPRSSIRSGRCGSLARTRGRAPPSANFARRSRDSMRNSLRALATSAPDDGPKGKQRDRSARNIPLEELVHRILLPLPRSPHGRVRGSPDRRERPNPFPLCAALARRATGRSADSEMVQVALPEKGQIALQIRAPLLLPATGARGANAKTKSRNRLPSSVYSTGGVFHHRCRQVASIFHEHLFGLLQWSVHIPSSSTCGG